MGQKTYTVLDTSVLLDNPNVLYEVDNPLVPYCVLSEVDDKKTHKYVGFKAREVVRTILGSDRIECTELDVSAKETDDRLVRASIEDNMRIITNDGALHMKAVAINGDSTYYDLEDVEQYTGVKKVSFPAETVNRLHDNHQASNPFDDLYQNQFVTDGRMIARHYEDVLYLVGRNTTVRGINALNDRQLMATDLIYDPLVTVVSMLGSAGTGKTSLAINGAMDLVQSNSFEKIIISRPKIQKGVNEEKLGYLSGGIEEKLSPFLQPFFDNLSKDNSLNLIETEPLSMVQGRDLENSVWIITEFQDVRPQDVDGIVERVGKGSKLIVEGDINQTSRSYLNKFNNGLLFLANNLKESELTSTVTLDEVMRSETAKLGKQLRECR
jgi:PhoH-like ATPase